MHILLRLQVACRTLLPCKAPVVIAQKHEAFSSFFGLCSVCRTFKRWTAGTMRRCNESKEVLKEWWTSCSLTLAQSLWLPCPPDWITSLSTATRCKPAELQCWCLDHQHQMIHTDLMIDQHAVHSLFACWLHWGCSSVSMH